LKKKSDSLQLLSDGKPCLTDGLCWGKAGMTYLGVYLWVDSVLQKKNGSGWKKLKSAWINGNGYYQIYIIEWAYSYF